MRHRRRMNQSQLVNACQQFDALAIRTDRECTVTLNALTTESVRKSEGRQGNPPLDDGALRVPSADGAGATEVLCSCRHVAHSVSRKWPVADTDCRRRQARTRSHSPSTATTASIFDACACRAILERPSPKTCRRCSLTISGTAKSTGPSNATRGSIPSSCWYLSASLQHLFAKPSRTVIASRQSKNRVANLSDDVVEAFDRGGDSVSHRAGGRGSQSLE